jgi:hypothetical protein
MIFAVEKPSINGHRFKKADILIFEHVSGRLTRVHEGLFQVFMDGPAYPEPQWVTFGRLLGSAETWWGLSSALTGIDVRKKRVLMVPAIGGL